MSSDLRTSIWMVVIERLVAEPPVVKATSWPEDEEVPPVSPDPPKCEREFHLVAAASSGRAANAVKNMLERRRVLYGDGGWYIKETPEWVEYADR